MTDEVEYDRIRPDKEDQFRAEGWRLRVFREARDPEDAVSSLTEICRERVHPEQILNPDARHIAESRSTGFLSPDEVRWIRDRLIELYPLTDEEIEEMKNAKSQSSGSSEGSH